MTVMITRMIVMVMMMVVGVIMVVLFIMVILVMIKQGLIPKRRANDHRNKGINEITRNAR